MASVSRRSFLIMLPALGLSASPRPTHASEPPPAVSSQPSAPGPDTAAARPVVDTFPTQPPELVKEMVGVSHGDVGRVRELVERQPSLARATWDWGFGDWESALDAASHVGNREIAEYLMSKGARPTLFTAAMLGRLDVVRAFVAAQPGIQRTTGPHGLTLAHHARAGGDGAAEVRRYLDSLGDADPKPAAVALSEAEMNLLGGIYAFGPGPRDKVAIAADRGALGFERAGGTRRPLTHVGAYAFFPAGSPGVRVRFEVTDGKARRLTVHDPDVVLRADRAES